MSGMSDAIDQEGMASVNEIDRLQQEVERLTGYVNAKCTIAGCWKSDLKASEARLEEAEGLLKRWERGPYGKNTGERDEVKWALDDDTTRYFEEPS